LIFRHNRYKAANCGVKTAVLYWRLTVVGHRRAETAKMLRGTVGPERLRHTVICETSLLELFIMLF